MSKTVTDRTLALAGLFQSAMLVDSVARKGMMDVAAFETMIRSLYILDAESTEDVYGSSSDLRTGYDGIASHLGSRKTNPDDANPIRYVIGLLHLERKLAKRKDLLKTISEGIEGAERQREHFGLTHDNTIAALADIYVNTISTLTPRIMVTGEHGHLEKPENVNRVRALLLAGIRSAVLWTQSGGTRLQLLFSRKRFLTEAYRLKGQSLH